MKKVLSITIMLLLAMLANAQVWQKLTEEADIVRGTSQRDFYTLTIDSITDIKVYADTNEWYLTRQIRKNYFKIKIKIFNVNLQELQTTASFGLFDENGQLVGKVHDHVRMTATNRARTIGSGKYTEKEAIKLLSYLKSRKGHVQIVIPLQFGGEENIIIPCISQ